MPCMASRRLAADVRGILRSLNATRFYTHVRDPPDGRFVGMIKVGFGVFRVIIADEITVHDLW